MQGKNYESTFKDTRNETQESTSSRTSFDSARRGVGASHVQTEGRGALGMVAEMSRLVLGAGTRDARSVSDITAKAESKMIGEIEFFSSVMSKARERSDTICRQSQAMLESETYAFFLQDSAYWKLELQRLQDSTKGYRETFEIGEKKYTKAKEEYDTNENNPDARAKYIDALTTLYGHINKATFTYFRLNAYLDEQENKLKDNCSTIKSQLSEKYCIRLSKTEILEGLEKHIYQNVGAILKCINNDAESKECEELLCTIVDHSHKATDESDKNVAYRMVAEELLAMLDDKELSPWAHKSLLKPLSRLGGKNEEAAKMVVDKFINMFRDQDPDYRYMRQHISQAIGEIARENKDIANVLVEPLSNVLYDKNVTKEQQYGVIEAFNWILYEVQKNDNLPNYITGKLSKLSKGTRLEPEVGQNLKQVINKWKGYPRNYGD